MSTYIAINTRAAAWLSAKAGSSLGTVAIAAWAFSEATFWFIAPDFLIMILCVFAPTAWKRIVIWALAGSLLGGMVSLSLNVLFFDQMASILQATPFVTARMIDDVDTVYSHLGHSAALRQSFSAIQFKIWTHLAVAHDFQPAIYLSLVMISRAARFGLAAFFVQLVGRSFPRVFSRHSLTLLLAFTVAFVGMLLWTETR
jgi:membrane protein YqaA with SNARE-associated domain